ncbi:MAG: hypothetical protein QXE80_08030, partial [Pyrobaculum sp.]
FFRGVALLCFLVFYLFLGGGLVFSVVRRVFSSRRRFALFFCTTFYKLDFRRLKTPKKKTVEIYTKVKNELHDVLKTPKNI